MKRLPAFLGATLLSGCSSGLRTAQLGTHPGDREQIEIADPPPPAKVEVIPPDPGERCVWLDGQWELQGRRWRWRDGGWHVPPPQCHFAPPVLVWVESGERGRLYFTPGRWYTESGEATCTAPVPCRGAR